MRIALAQLNPTVGDLAGNRRLVEEAAAKAASERADLLVAPEMVLTGYPPMDLLERDGFVRDQLRELDALAASSRQVAIALGAVLPVEGGRRGAFHNACVLLAGGQRVAARAKTHLPDLRRVQRAALFRSRRAARAGAVRRRRHDSGSHRLRGHLGRAAWAMPWIRSASSRARAPTSCSTRRARRGTRARRASGAA